MALIKKTVSSGQCVTNLEPVYSAGGNVSGALWDTVLQKLQLTYDPAILVLGIYPGELEMYIHTKSCTGMFIAALFILVKK